MEDPGRNNGKQVLLTVPQSLSRQTVGLETFVSTHTMHMCTDTDMPYVIDLMSHGIGKNAMVNSLLKGRIPSHSE